MLIRITQAEEGIEDYFETGIKQGRNAMRDELDSRVHLSGDLNTFALTVQYTRDTNQDWKEHYWHLTASFAIENNDLNDYTLKAINREMMKYYFCAYDVDKLIHAAEAHKPKLQSMVDESTGELKQRLLHIHNAVSKYDTETGNQIRMIPYNQAADRAFQSHICEKYGLVDPVTRMREIPVTKKDIIARWKGDGDTTKQTKVADLRKLFSQLINDVDDLEQAKEILMATDIVSDVTFKEIKNSGNKYLQVKTNIGTRNINLRGKGFEKIEKLYYSNSNAPQSTSSAPQDTSIDNESIFKAHQKWWLEEQAKREPKADRKINYAKSQKKYESYYDKFSREQRRYFVIYRNNIQEESIRGYRIFEKANERQLVNNDLGVKIFDRLDKIVLELPNDPEKRSQAIKLALSIAQSKGWNLATMKITGSFEFQEEVKRQIFEINKVNAKVPAHAKIKSKPKVSAQPKSKLNVVKQALHDAKEVQLERLSKEQIITLKASLDAQLVINYARTKYELLGEHFTVTSDNKINDDRTKAKPRNVIDFLTKTCNLNIAEAMPVLQELYNQQLKNEVNIDMDISICTSSNPNGLGGWQHKQPRTFTELATLVKSNSYAGFTELKDNYRKIDNIVQLGNCAIFDIDNDPDQPNLIIEQAQEMLKDTTFMLVTSKSHQVEKVKPGGGILPKVDRYRIIVPMTQSLSVNKDEYRLGIMKLADELGLAEYADPKALKDIVRQYYKSPVDAQVIVNNTKKAFDSAPASIFATSELIRLEAEKVAAREAILNRAKVDKITFNDDQSAYPKIIDLDAINRLPLPEIYQLVTGQELTQDGSYLMGRGITAATSQSRASFTVFEANGNWLWHDFKSSENGNVITFMREAAGLDIFKAAQMLSNHFNIELMTDNPSYYENALKTALMDASNDKELEQSIKEQTSANFVKLEKDTIKIGDKEFKLSELNITKSDLITSLRSNRNESSLKF